MTSIRIGEISIYFCSRRIACCLATSASALQYKFKTSLQHSVNGVASLAAQDELTKLVTVSSMGLSTAAEVNDYMKTRSYVEGYAFSAKDVEVFGKIGLPDQKARPHAYRWYVHTAALSGSKCLALVAGGAGSKPTPAPATRARHLLPDRAAVWTYQRYACGCCFWSGRPILPNTSTSLAEKA